MTEGGYLLCALASTACAVLLKRAWSRQRTRLLLYSALCFVWLPLNNALLFVDRVLVPDSDLSLPRTLTSMMGAATLLCGLIWDAP